MSISAAMKNFQQYVYFRLSIRDFVIIIEIMLKCDIVFSRDSVFTGGKL